MRKTSVILFLAATLILTGCGTRFNLLRPGSFLRPFVDIARPIFCPTAKALANMEIAKATLCKSTSPAAQAICLAAQLKADKIITEACEAPPISGTQAQSARAATEEEIASADPTMELRRVFESVGMSAEEAKRKVASLPRTRE